MRRWGWIAMLLLVALACQTTRRAAPEESEAAGHLAAGFRYSVYGPDFNPGAEYWGEVGRQMAERFPGSVPGTVWIVGRLYGQGTELSFPGRSEDPLIQFTEEDANEKTLTLFDELGFECWLQVEPGNAPVEELIHLMLDRYAHHPCVVGVGVDVEWFRSVEEPDGDSVTDEEAAAWLAAVREHDPAYRLFLKHWLIEKMPPTVRDGLLFIDDSQIFPSVDAMVAEFAEWGKAFAPAPVGFQYGYPNDRPWWQEFSDPALEIGQRIREVVPNVEALYWVDFTALEVFPPDPALVARYEALAPKRVTDPIVGMKIYQRPGDPEEMFRAWRDLGVTTAFVGEALAEDVEFRRLVLDHGVEIFVIAPVFYNPAALDANPDLIALTSTGKQARDDWVEFVCPSRESYREERVARIRDLVGRVRPDGLSLDFIRHFVFWEKVHPATLHGEIPNACFCPVCVRSFSAKADIAIPEDLRETADLAAWILEHHAGPWTEWKIGLVESMTARIAQAAREVDPEIMISIHAVPWRRTDFGGAILRSAGQDFERLSRYADFLSPMTYAHMIQRPPDWIHSVVVRLDEESSAPVLPSIQVRQAYRPGVEFSDHEFEEHLREALKLPSRGVIFWSWEAFESDPSKLRIATEVLREAPPAQTEHTEQEAAPPVIPKRSEESGGRAEPDVDSRLSIRADSLVPPALCHSEA